MAKEKKCAECGAVLDGEHGLDSYKHTVTCFHLPDIGREGIVKLLKGRTDLYAVRALKNLTADADK